MKYSLLFLFIMFGVCVSSHSQQQPECDAHLISTCSQMLDKFTLAKSIDIKPSMYKYGGEKVEFSCFFSKGSTYVITLCDENPTSNKLMVDVYDKNKRLITRNFDANNKKYYTKIFFPCSATGMYYLKYSFHGGKPTCGASTLGVQSYTVKKL